MHLHVSVVVWRGSIAESRHSVQIALCGPDDPGAAADAVTTLRSAAKPFQLVPLVERGHADRFGWSDEQLAVMAASHSGSAYHVGLVRGILEGIGCSDADFACGYHDVFDPVSRAHLAAHPAERTAIYNNCSGKHAGMLSLARSEGWPLAGYELPDHPLQQLMHLTVAEICGLETSAVPSAIDGCNVPVFAMPLGAMARGYARLATAAETIAPRVRALARIRAAMTAYPVATDGAGRFNATLMQVTGGRLVAKGGAEGLECVGITSRGVGLALKCEDGEARAVVPATIAVLEHMGELSPSEIAELAAFRRPQIRNHVGRTTGFLEAVVHAAAPVAG